MGKVIHENGPKLRVLKELATETSKSYEDKLQFIAKAVGQKTVRELEALSTALMVTLDHTQSPNRTGKLQSLKPHLDTEQATAAVTEIDLLKETFSREFSQN